MQHRKRRVADQLRAELAQLIQHETKDPEVGFVTLTEVRMSPDLRYAKVWVSVLGDDAREEESLAALKRAAGYLRRELGRRLRLRHVPELTFVLDETLDRSDRLDDLLDAGEVEWDGDDDV